MKEEGDQPEIGGGCRPHRSTGKPRTITLPAATPPTVGWLINCKMSHEAMNDPIAFPSQATMPSRRTIASYGVGLPASTSMNPTLFFNGSPIGYRQNEINFYYRSRTYPMRDVPRFSAGLVVVAMQDAFIFRMATLNKSPEPSPGAPRLIA